MMILDLDDFQKLNDEEGRMFGDAILAEVADILKSSVGPCLLYTSHCWQNKHNRQHTDDRTPSHQVAHGADHVDVGIKPNSEGCREEAQSADKNRGNGG